MFLYNNYVHVLYCIQLVWDLTLWKALRWPCAGWQGYKPSINKYTFYLFIIIIIIIIIINAPNALRQQQTLQSREWHGRPAKEKKEQEAEEEEERRRGETSPPLF